MARLLGTLKYYPQEVQDVNKNSCFRTNDHPHPGPYRLEPICVAQGFKTVYHCWNRHPLTCALDVFLLFLLIRELLECFSRGAKQYFKSKENYLQLSIYILTITFIYTAPYDMVAANHFAGWSVFLACVNVTQLLGRIDFFGKVIFMAFDVTKEISKSNF